MLKCLNCGTLCEAGATQCHHCRMKGRFKRVESEDALQHNQGDATNDKLHTCRNCGASLLPTIEKCPACNMPISGRKTNLASQNGKAPNLGKQGLVGNLFCKPCFHPFKIEKQWLVENINFSTSASSMY